MSNTNKEILAILRHYWKLSRNTVDAARILLEGEDHDASPIVQHKIGTRNSKKVTPTFKRNYVTAGHLL